MRQLDTVGVPAPEIARRMTGSSFWLPSRTDMLSNTGASTPTSATVTGDGVAHTKGAWAQIVAATSADATLLTVGVSTATSASATNSATLLDIGVGAAASEAVLVADLPIGQLGPNFPLMYRIPVAIPRGTRIAARLQSAQTTKTADVFVRLGRLPHAAQPTTRTVTFGVNSAASTGTVINYPGSDNTKSSWVQVTASTTDRLGALVVGVTGAGDTSLGGNAGTLVDIGVGGSGSEVVLVPDIYAPVVGTTEQVFNWDSWQIYPAEIPTGSRIAARAAFGNNANNCDVVVIGIPWKT